MATTNPWKGVVSYTGTAEESKRYPFRGRDKDIDNLVEMIDQNAITTLYGRSGIGKTSLIRAGVIPKLREYGCYPVYIRLQTHANGTHFVQMITQELAPIAVPISEEVESQSEDCRQKGYLWHYFASHSFTANGQPTTPIIFLDQFEETLRNPQSKDEAILLLQQLRETLEEGYLKGTDAPYAINFRFVISLREDDLFLLEEALDTNYIDKMKNSRYRLRPIDRQTAIDEIVFIREGLFDKNKEVIANKLADLATQEGAVSSLLLSLVCSMAYEAAEGGIITLDTIKQIGETPLITYYKKAIHGLPESFIEFIETEFIDEDRRSIVYSSSIKAEYLSLVEKLADDTNENRLLTKASTMHTKDTAYELLHDKLAEAISKYRAERLANLKRKRYKRAIATILLLILFAVGAILVAGRPNVFSGRTNMGGGTIPVGIKPYTVQDGYLQLSHCKVQPYTFYGNKEVRKLLLDSVILEKNAIYLPNVDTLVIGSDQWIESYRWIIGFGYLHDALPNVKEIITERPNCDIAVGHLHLPLLCHATISSDDTDVLHWDSDTRTLFARANTESQWKAYASAYGRTYYLEGTHTWGTDVRSCRLLPIDIANIQLPKTIDDKTFYKLINTDSTIRVISKALVPDSILERVAFVDLPYITHVAPGLFANNRFTQRVILPDALEIGDSAWYETYALKELVAPRVRRIGRYTFYNSGINSIVLDSARFIGERAFSVYHTKINKVYLPSVDSIEQNAFGYSDLSNDVWLQYNIDCPSAREIFKNYKISVETAEDTVVPSEGYHYSALRDTLYLDSTVISKLFIPKETRYIIAEDRYEGCQIDHISLEFGNRALFLWHGNLYDAFTDQKDKAGLVLRSNSERLFSMPQNACAIANYIRPKGTWKEYICLNRSDLNRLRDKGKITLRVPYGQIDQYSAIGKEFEEIKEMNLIETYWYTLFYSHIWLTPRRLLMRSTIETRDILPFVTCVVILLIITMAFRRKEWKKYVWWDGTAILLIIVLSFLYLVIPSVSLGDRFACSCGETFRSFEELFKHLQSSDCLYLTRYTVMWPSIFVATPIYILYMWIFNVITKKRRKQ